MLAVEELLEAPAENALELPAIGRLEVDQVRQSHPHQRGDDRLMRPPFTAQGDARGGTSEDELGAGVYPVDQRVQAACHEGVVNRPHWKQDLTVVLMGEPE